MPTNSSLPETTHSNPPASAPDESAGGGRSALVEELERRIEEIGRMHDDEFGGLTVLDWVICVLGALVLPFAAVLWFAG